MFSAPLERGKTRLATSVYGYDIKLSDREAHVRKIREFSVHLHCHLFQFHAERPE